MSLIRKLRDRLQGATLHDLWVETRWVLHAEPAVESLLA